ncbi:hypothetical protein D3C75_927680 [compost metagenome]
MSDFPKVYIRPDFGGVQWIELIAAQLFGFEYLHIQVPLWKIPFVDMADQIVGHVAVISTLHLSNALGRKVSGALQALPVELDVMHFVLGIDELVGMYAVAVHFPIAGGNAGVGIQLGEGAGGFGYVGKEIEMPGAVTQIGAWVGLERVDHVRELDGIANEKSREIVAHQIPVAVGGVELGGEAARVAQGFRRVSAMDHG